MNDSPMEDRLADALDRVLNKGIVMDAPMRASPAGAQSHAGERVVIASSETCLAHIDRVSYAAPPALYAEPISGATGGFADPSRSPGRDGATG